MPWQTIRRGLSGIVNDSDNAPGRVNIIGEHTDYNGLPVLPMAIDRSVLVAAARRDDPLIRLASADSRFPPRSYSLAEPIRAEAVGDWSNYHRAAVRALLPTVGSSAAGGDYLIDSDVPIGAGLSSSSALVVGSGLAFLALHDREEPRLALAELLAAAERFVGTHSGGMDQAACLLAQAAHAMRIDFDPLRVQPVRMPPGCGFVVCHSLIIAEKSSAARLAYNHRVIECRLACRVLERILGTSLPRPLRHFGELQRLFPDRPVSEFVAALESVLPPRPLSIDEIAAIIGTPARSLDAEVGARATGEASYWLLHRARHVLTEAERVEEAQQALAAGDWTALGALMDASHASCRDDYAISCPEIEELGATARAVGAMASRLTGAGFGGCTINLVEETVLSLFCTRMERTFYQDKPLARTIEHCFGVAASDGASVTRT
jgi:galactokinase